MQFMQDYADRLQARGEYIDGQAVAPTGTFVRYDGEGQPQVTDVDHYDRAVEFAGELSAAPAAAGKPLQEWIELRPFLGSPITITD